MELEDLISQALAAIQAGEDTDAIAAALERIAEGATLQ